MSKKSKRSLKRSAPPASTLDASSSDDEEPRKQKKKRKGKKKKNEKEEQASDELYFRASTVVPYKPPYEPVLEPLPLSTATKVRYHTEVVLFPTRGSENGLSPDPFPCSHTHAPRALPSSA